MSEIHGRTIINRCTTRVATPRAYWVSLVTDIVGIELATSARRSTESSISSEGLMNRQQTKRNQPSTGLIFVMTPVVAGMPAAGGPGGNT